MGRVLAHYLDQPAQRYEAFAVAPPHTLRKFLRPGDILLVEGDKRISVAIKYLTQSTWSHAAICVGDAIGDPGNGIEPKTLIEADLQDGVIAVALSKYENFNTRICRPIGLTDDDRRKVVQFMVKNLGLAYDLKNVIDLMRYLLPQPPVPQRWRRRMLSLGSGSPTRAICSTLIAQAFQSVRYPILPVVLGEKVHSYVRGEYTTQDIMYIRHHSLYTPRDFDLSPYFQVIKPTIEDGFDYKQMVWHDRVSTDFNPTQRDDSDWRLPAGVRIRK